MFSDSGNPGDYPWIIFGISDSTLLNAQRIPLEKPLLKQDNHQADIRNK